MKKNEKLIIDYFNANPSASLNGMELGREVKGWTNHTMSSWADDLVNKGILRKVQKNYVRTDVRHADIKEVRKGGLPTIAIIEKVVNILCPNNSEFGNIRVIGGSVIITNLMTSFELKNVFPKGYDFCLDAKRFVLALKFQGMESEISPNMETESIEIKGLHGTSKLMLENKEDFPFPPDGDFMDGFELCEGDLSNIKAAVKFISNDELRPVMNNVLFGKDYICGTNAHKLYYAKPIIEPKTEILISKEVVRIFNTMDFTGSECTVSDQKNARFVKFENDRVILTHRITDGKYPNVGLVINHEVKGVIEIEKNEFINSVKNILNLMKHDGFYSKALEFSDTPDGVGLTYKNEDYYSTHKISMDGKTTLYDITHLEKFGLKADFMLSILNECEAGKIKMEVEAPNRAIHFNGKILLMPVMLDN